MMNRRLCLAGMAGVTLMPMALSARAAEPKLVYADTLMPGWRTGGWAKNTLQFTMGDQKPVEITMDPWSMFALQTDAPFETKDFQVLTVVLHGGDDGRQEFKVALKLGEKLMSQEINLRCAKGEWGRIDIPLSRFRVKGAIDTISFQNKSPDKLAPFYLNFVLFQ